LASFSERLHRRLFGEAPEADDISERAAREVPRNFPVQLLATAIALCALSAAVASVIALKLPEVEG